MLFNSLEFIFFFLPVVFIVYFFLNKKRLIIAAKSWLVGSSLFFYSWWNIDYLPLILTSLFFNYAVGSSFGKNQSRISRKVILVIGITLNIGLLVYFKYSDFFITNINTLFNIDIPMLKLSLPLAISFFTFQQIAYLVDAYKTETSEYDFLNYALFVTFFPQLIAGPIVHHKEMMPQFRQLRNKIINYRNIASGIFVFSIGLFKKIAIADTFATWATLGFDHTETLTFFESWITSLSYTLQLYFDFSGYTDMAVGSALLFNISLPINFNSPYKALDIQDFWRRWHITLSRFLTQYIYIPLGGSRKGKGNTYIYILIVFLISGLWHGAGWTFIFWGFLHGVATIVNRYWKSLNIKINKAFAWLITFNFVNTTWIFFRAKTWEDAIKVLKGMLGLNGLTIPLYFTDKFPVFGKMEFSSSIFFIGNFDLLKSVIAIIIGLFVALLLKNSNQLLKNFKLSYYKLVLVLIIFVFSVMNLNKISEFLYFNF